MPLGKHRPLGHASGEPITAPIRPRDAASLIVWRNGPNGLEVLMGRRSRSASFVPGFFVFPGGSLERADYLVRPATPLNSMFVQDMGVCGNVKKAEALAIAAVRETFEEAGLLVAERGDIGAAAHAHWTHWKTLNLAPGLSRLIYVGRAITSRSSPIRFNARFFSVHADALEGRIGGAGELSDIDFYSIKKALDCMPIVDVTAFLLVKLLEVVTADSTGRFEPPIFSYRGTTPFVHYRVARAAKPQLTKKMSQRFLAKGFRRSIS